MANNAISKMMQRTKPSRKPDAILTADWHLREDTPTCWTGDFQSEQWEVVQTIFDLQAKFDCPVIHAGDLFDHWKPSPWLLSKTMFFLPQKFCTVYGQHDLPQHNWELRDKSGIYTLERAGRVYVLPGCHYGETPEDLLKNHLSTQSIIDFKNDKFILVWHHMAYNILPPYPGAPEGNAVGILRKYPQFNLILTGDNHESFTVTLDGRRLVNPGNITRQTAAQIDYKPRVYLWYVEDNSVIPVFLPVSDNVITREYIDIEKEKNGRIEAFVTHLKDNWGVSRDKKVSFEENLEAFFEENNTEKDLRDLVYKHWNNGR